MAWLLLPAGLLFLGLGIAISRDPARAAEFITSMQRRTFGAALGGSDERALARRTAGMRAVAAGYIVMGGMVAVLAVLFITGIIPESSI